MELIDGAPQHICIRRGGAADNAACRRAGFDPHPRRQRQGRAPGKKGRIQSHKLQRTGFQSDPNDVAHRTTTPLAGWNFGSAIDRHLAYIPTRVWTCDHSGEPRDPGGHRIDGQKFRTWRHQRFGAGAADGDHLDACARAVDGFRQIENDLAALDPKQMVPRAARAAFDNADGEDIGIPCHDLQHVLAMVEKLRTTAIEHDARRQTGRRRLIGRCMCLLEDSVGHS